MKKKKILVSSLVVGLTSLLYIDFYVQNFKFSLAGVFFPLLLFLYDDFHPVVFGFLSGFSLVLFRTLFYGLLAGNFINIINYSLPENVFYIVYGLMFFILKSQLNPISHNKMFIVALISDIFSNIVEVYIRVGDNLFTQDYEVLTVLLLVAVIRAGMVWLAVMGHRYHKLFLKKEEHDRRYKDLLRLISQFETEIYWAEKNMAYIENVMSDAYKLFTKIKDGQDQESWSSDALMIAKNVHEIKKEYSLVVMGLEEIMADRLDSMGMYYSELILVLRESLAREIRKQDKEIDIHYRIGKDFYTERHHYLMSILRNLIMNSIDAIEGKGRISVAHELDDINHLFIIKDSGQGISQADLPYIFSPGYSTKIDYDTGQINRGLGLTLVEKLLEMHFKGKIEVESNLRKGSTFSISIPSKRLESVNK